MDLPRPTSSLPVVSSRAGLAPTPRPSAHPPFELPPRRTGSGTPLAPIGPHTYPSCGPRPPGPVRVPPALYAPGHHARPQTSVQRDPPPSARPVGIRPTSSVTHSRDNPAHAPPTTPGHAQQSSRRPTAPARVPAAPGSQSRPSHAPSDHLPPPSAPTSPPAPPPLGYRPHPAARATCVAPRPIEPPRSRARDRPPTAYLRPPPSNPAPHCPPASVGLSAPCQDMPSFFRRAGCLSRVRGRRAWTPGSEVGVPRRTR